ncbi:MAG TPA: UbiA family prenyltransferase, partial [Pyrinomonadaceae bacterium]|nr:UbiA family prenyltransferase [Pyrinomonadaceae bacterium]
MAAFAVFCALSGAVYLFNDVADREADQRHPLKRERPIASGQLSVPAAVTTGALLGAGGVAAAFSIGTMFGVVAATYLTSLLLYSV